MKNNEIKFVGKQNLVLIHYHKQNVKTFLLVDRYLGMNIQFVISCFNLLEFSFLIQIRIGHPIPEEEYNRETVKYSEQRTIRLLDMVNRTNFYCYFRH
jgi:hypothetical protein